MPIYNVTDPETGQSIELEGDSPPTEQELNEIFASLSPATQQAATPDIQQPRQLGQMGRIAAQDPVQPQQEQTQPIAPIVQTGQSSRGNTRREVQDLTNRFEAGEITSSDLTDRQVEDVRAERVKRIPEISQTGFKSLSENQGLMQALAGVTTYNEDEFAQILQKADPNIGVVTTPDGERLAVNNETKEAVSLNKIGPSLIDALQLGAGIGLLTPAGRLSTIPKIALGSAASQAGIEGLQASQGGDFNKADIAIAGAAVPVFAKTIEGVTSAVNKLKSNLALNAPKDASKFIPKEKNFDPNFPLFGQQSKTTQAIRKAIESGEGDNITARYIIDGAGKVVKNKDAINVINQGKRTDSLHPGSVAAYVGSSQNDKLAMRKMLDEVAKGLKNARYATEHRPGGVVGNTLMKRFNHVKEVNQKAGKEVGEAAKDLKNITVDINPGIANFSRSLDDIGVKFDAEGKLNFDSSSITSSGRSLLKEILPKIEAYESNPTGFQAHILKKAIQKNVSFGERKIEDPLDPEIATLTKVLMNDINETIGASSQKYKQANEVFSETIGAINEFRKRAGSNFNMDSPNVNEFVGKLSRRLLSNAQSREPIMDAIAGLESVGRKHGGDFNDDIFTQILFVDDLEKTFGAFAQTGFQAEVAKGAGKALRGDKTGLVIDGLTAVGQKALRRDEANALKALRQLVR